MKKITIYAVHSNKLNYKDDFYKALLLSKECSKHHLILPLTEKYENMFAKELVENSDIIIINLTNSSLSVFIETKWAIKMNKKILFLLKDNGKCSPLMKKYKQLSKKYYSYEDEIKIIDEFILNNIDGISSKDESGIINIGSIN